MAKVQMVVDHFFYDKTNELVKPETRLIGTFVSGEWFFQPLSGHLSDKAARLLSGIFINPSRGIKSLNSFNLNEPKSIGETWESEVLPDPTGLNQLDNSVAGIVARLIVKGVNTNTAKTTVQFVGTNTVSSLNCFHLCQTSRIREPWPGLDFSADFRSDVIMPFDASHIFFTNSESVDVLAFLIDAVNRPKLIRGRFTFSLNSHMECRELFNQSTNHN